MIDGFTYLKYLDFGDVFRFRGRVKLYVYHGSNWLHKYEDLDTYYLVSNKHMYEVKPIDASMYVEVMGTIWDDEFMY